MGLIGVVRMAHSLMSGLKPVSLSLCSEATEEAEETEEGKMLEICYLI